MNRYIRWHESYIDSLCRLWNQEIGDDFNMHPALLLQNTLQTSVFCEQASSIVIDEERREAVALLAAKLEGEKGSISVLLVADDYRGRGIGSDLLSKAEQALFRLGARKIELGRDERHFFSGVPAQYDVLKRWLEKRGYCRTDRCFDMMFETENISVHPISPQVLFRPLSSSRNEQEQLLGLLENEFPPRWRRTAEHHYRAGGSPEDYIGAWKNNQLIGFLKLNHSGSPGIPACLNWVPPKDKRFGGIGPLGIAGSEQGKGYGSAIFQAGMAYLQQKGCQKIVVDWTSAVGFYSKFGFVPWKSYDGYVKMIPIERHE